MIFNKTSIEGVYLITLEKHNDCRGFFARTFDKNEFFSKNIPFDVLQTSISYNKIKGSVRGMHWQDFPYPEEKIIQCVKGSIYDVLIDLRNYSKTYNKWFSFNLDDKNNSILYVPIGIAHGFQTLEDDTTILYYMNQEYHKEYSRILPHNDPIYNIEWKLPITSISYQDLYCCPGNLDREIYNQKLG